MKIISIFYSLCFKGEIFLSRIFLIFNFLLLNNNGNFWLVGGFFLEAGANDAESFSDSLHFELNRGWKVPLIRSVGDGVINQFN